jgi:hypothetical protein
LNKVKELLRSETRVFLLVGGLQTTNAPDVIDGPVIAYVGDSFAVRADDIESGHYLPVLEFLDRSLTRGLQGVVNMLTRGLGDLATQGLPHPTSKGISTAQSFMSNRKMIVRCSLFSNLSN